MIFPQTNLTSAGGQLRKAAAVAMLSVLGPMTTATPCASPIAHDSRPITTNAGTPLVKARGANTSDAISELRRISGLTWEQLAGMLQVTRRTLHFWANDKQMHPTNEERVHRALAALRRIDRGAPGLTRAALLENGAEALDMLTEGDFAGLELLLSSGFTASRTPRKVPPQVLAERKPPSPADLVQSSQDGPHPATLGGSRVRSMKATRIPRGK